MFQIRGYKKSLKTTLGRLASTSFPRWRRPRILSQIKTGSKQKKTYTVLIIHSSSNPQLLLLLMVLLLPFSDVLVLLNICITIFLFKMILSSPTNSKAHPQAPYQGKIFALPEQITFPEKNSHTETNFGMSSKLGKSKSGV